jgi:hypothetical protein
VAHVEHVYLCPVSKGFHHPTDYWAISPRVGYSYARCVHCHATIWRTYREDRYLFPWSEEYVIDEEPY